MDLYDLVGNMQEIGFYDILLPWAMFFAIIFGLLSKVGPFKAKEQKGIVSIISMAVAFFIVGYTPFGSSFGVYLAEFFGKSGTILAGLLVASIFLAMAGLELPSGFGKDKDKSKLNFAIIVIIIVGAIYFTTGFDDIINFTAPNVAEDTIVTILVILALAGGMYMMIKGDGKTKVDDESGDDNKGNDDNSGNDEAARQAEIEKIKKYAAANPNMTKEEQEQLWKRLQELGHKG